MKGLRHACRLMGRSQALELGARTPGPPHARQLAALDSERRDAYSFAAEGIGVHAWRAEPVVGAAAMSGKPPNVIGYAVQSCLQMCALTDMPMTCLHDYESELKAAGWDDQSLSQFRRLVLLSLGPQLGPPGPAPNPPDSTNVAE